MEDYYHKVIKLQEMLRKSEEERLNLEIKFNETLQLIKQEEEVHLKRFRTKYRKFLDEDKRRQQRNYKILEALDRIENRTSMWETKTEKFRAVRKKYQSCINLPSSTKYHQDFKEISKPVDYSVAEKNIVIDKYLDNFSPQNYNSDNEKPIDNTSFLNKYSNLGNINSAYSKFSDHEKTDPEKVKSFDATPLKTTKDYENILKQNSDSQDNSFNKRWNQNEKPLTFSKNDNDNLRSNYFPDIEPLLKAPQTIIRLTQPEGKNLVENNFQESELLMKNWNEDEKPSSKYNEEEPPERKNYDVTISNREDYIEKKGKITDDELLQENYGVHQLVDEREEEDQHKQPSMEHENKEHEQNGNVVNMTEDLQNSDAVGPPLQMNDDRNETVLRQSRDYPQVTDIKRQLSQSNIIENQKILNDEISVTNEQEQFMEKNEENGTPIQHYDEHESLPQQYEEKFEPSIQQNDENGQSIQRYGEDEQYIRKSEESENLIRQQEENEKLTQQYEESEQTVQQYEENKQPYHKQYEENEQQYNKNEEPIQQNDGNRQSYHEQYDKDGNPIQQYNASEQHYPQQYDENGQPIQQYDANGHQSYPQQYDENGQPVQQFDEIGKPIQQYETSGGQPYHQQYEENGQPIQQYDENGQPIQQYDANGQSYHQQYDEHGQPIQQYDASEQPYPQQYDENGQPIQQYDENGQLIQQYDANGQSYHQQYDEHGQPVQQPYPQQYDENGQPIQQYDENGQPYPQYDANGQILQYYDENGQPVQQYGEYEQQYDENGQPLQYDENGQLIQHPDNSSGQPSHDADKQILLDDQEKDQPKSNVLDILETDTESLKIESKISNDSDFDISNAGKN